MGNKHERDKAFFEVVEERAADAVMYVTRCMEGRWSSDYDITGINFRGPQMDGGEVLAIVKAFADDGTPVVAFHSAMTFGETLTGLVARLRNGQLKWKVDDYAKRTTAAPPAGDGAK